MSKLKHPFKTKLEFRLALLRDKPYIWSRPIDWIRYTLLWNEDMYYD